MDQPPRRSPVDATLGEIEAIITRFGATTVEARALVATLLQKLTVEDLDAQATVAASSGKISE